MTWAQTLALKHTLQNKLAATIMAGKDKHATVRLGEYTVPLIGIPPSATQAECERCHAIFHLADVKLHTESGEFLCDKCMECREEFNVKENEVGRPVKPVAEKRGPAKILKVSKPKQTKRKAKR